MMVNDKAHCVCELCVVSYLLTNNRRLQSISVITSTGKKKKKETTIGNNNNKNIQENVQGTKRISHTKSFFFFLVLLDTNQFGIVFQPHFFGNLNNVTNRKATTYYRSKVISV